MPRYIGGLPLLCVDASNRRFDPAGVRTKQSAGETRIWMQREQGVVCELAQEALSLWRQEEICPAPFERTFTPGEQAPRERHLDRFLQTIEAELRELPRTKTERNAARSRITSGFVDFAKGSLDLDDRHLELLLNDGFSTVATQLAREARQLDRDVSAADIFQASRNAWTACGLQTLMGQRMHLTPAIFAYSMLYPYTDNYLDDPTISLQAKVAFNERFRQRLGGCAVAPFNEREAAIWALVKLIEEQYARADWPGVYGSLLRIQHAQENSIRELRLGSSLTDDEVLKVSFEKGGASVLADAYLAAGSLSAEEQRVAFGWGVLLQIVDDLQDVRQDLREGNLTLFTQCAAREAQEQAARTPLDEVTTRTLNFGHRIMRQVDAMRSDHLARQNGEPKRSSLKEMIRMSSSLLLIWSAAACRELYTRKYLQELERHSPFRFACLDAKRKKLARWTPALTRLFELFLKDEEDENASLLLVTSLVARI